MRYKIHLDFIKHRKKFFIFSIALTVIGIVMLAAAGLNYGVDFRSGTNMDVEVGKPITIEQAERIVAEAGFEGVRPTIGGDGDRVTIRFPVTLTQQEVEKVEGLFKAQFGDQVSREVNSVDSELAREQLRHAIIAVLVASIGIILYVSIRFEWRFAIAGIVALLHDAFIVITIFAIFRLEVNLTFIVAVLTIIGYSINDTIVIFDRIRENLRFAKLKSDGDLALVVNNSIWQTFTRSINTVVTVLVAAVALFIFGSESIRLFSLAIIIGLVAGAYSSIGIASPIWYVLKKGSLGRSK
ncbi:protein translocase subunit SecF [Paenibacillus antri]|uniref:Protein-export membrane protein SecF n=1 Tax=Paenibacillus antri TaxID=2582848 RepID=A0A5R9GAT6_9BACL|nr:protein translocase subunit SecF [Paenibacillus antri]TLS53567.1 protein translocase subunit SecF [Paenibacillus antri]